MSGTTTDHAEIQNWAEGLGGRLAAVGGTGSGAVPGILRIAFPERSESDDESRSNKLVSRSNVEA